MKLAVRGKTRMEQQQPHSIGGLKVQLAQGVAARSAKTAKTPNGTSAHADVELPSGNGLVVP
jgi:hypothetical protein